MKVSKTTHPNCYQGHQYALDIISGKIPACIYVKGACQRYLSDVDNDSDDFYFDIDYAERYLRLVQKFQHVIGIWSSPYIIYDPWQCWVWMNIMGFKLKATKLRRFRVAHVEIPRGNSKSTQAAQCALFFLALDNPMGNQISTVATKRDQARIVLDSSRSMARKNSSFLKHSGAQVLAHSIVHPESDSAMRALSSDSASLDGLNDILAVMDELHAMDRDVFDVVTSGMSKRKDSLVLCITTAGKNLHSVGYSQSAYAKKVCTGEVNDPQLFSVVYTLDADDDWTDESVWIKANPGLGGSVDPTTLRAKVSKAIHTPADQAGVRIKHFNQWIGEADAFFSLEAWDKCYDPNLKIEDYYNKTVRLGLDLAAHIDIASIGIVFKDGDNYTIFDKSFLPEKTVSTSKNTLYKECVDSGHLIETKGAAINYQFIQNEIEDLGKRFKVSEVMYDAWNATETAQRLSDKFEMVKVAMNVGNFSEPMKKLDTAIRKGQVRHTGSPLLRWCLGNVVAKEDHNGNVFPRKSSEHLKIDPIVAILMAIAGWLQNTESESVYESRGIRTL